MIFMKINYAHALSVPRSLELLKTIFSQASRLWRIVCLRSTMLDVDYMTHFFIFTYLTELAISCLVDRKWPLSELQLRCILEC